MFQPLASCSFGLGEGTLHQGSHAETFEDAGVVAQEGHIVDSIATESRGCFVISWVLNKSE